MNRAQQTIAEARALVAEYGGPGVRLVEQVRRCVEDRDAARVRVKELELQVDRLKGLAP